MHTENQDLCMKFVHTGECHVMKSDLMHNAIYIYQALLIDENNEKPSHSLTISLKSRAISLFGEETGWNSMCLLKGELATTKLYAQEKKNWREKKKKNKRTQN